MVVYPNYSRVPVDYYMERVPGAEIAQPMFPTPAWGQYFPGKVDGATMQVALTTQKTPAKRIWVVYRYAPPIPSSADGKVLATATGNKAPVTEVHFPYVGVQLYLVAP